MEPRRNVRWRDLSLLARTAIVGASIIGVSGAFMWAIIIIFFIALIITHGQIHIT